MVLFRNFALMVGFAGIAANLGAILAQPTCYSSKHLWMEKYSFRAGHGSFAILYYTSQDDPKDMGLPGMDELEGRPATASDMCSEALNRLW